MAESLIISLSKQLASFTAQEIRLVVGVDEEVRMMEANLQTVKAVLNDAEKKQVTDNTVKLWLDRLKDVCYEMDDVLDEWNTAMIKADIEKKEQLFLKKVCCFILSLLCCFREVDKLFLRHDIAHKIKEVNRYFDEIVRERERFHFHESSGVNAPEVVERPITTSFVNVSEIYGRDKVKDDLVNILLGNGSEEERYPHVISLVGMGGIGKTTLAQQAYNDPAVKGCFDMRIWVCVSEPFDQCRVAKEILESIKHETPNVTSLDNLTKKIVESIRKKKFFLVLDDVWTEDSALWEPFKCALSNGAQGSRILATTRNSRVAVMMGGLRTGESLINLEMLSEEDCWLVFRKIAFVDRDRNQREELENVGKKIAERCKGLPLAAKTLGSLMRFKSSRVQWETVLDSSLWELEDLGNFVEKGIFGPLLLSYNDLPSPLKQCFSFCAVFPKDYVFHIDDLVYMWMALGYIDSKENMEPIGREYFLNLALRSFFQDFEQSYKKRGEIIRCKMHDIVHDFAQSITRNDCFIINDVTRSGSSYRYAHHFRLKISREAVFPVSVYDAKKLRTLILEVPRDYNIVSFFQHYRCLRSLTLDFLCAEFQELPDAVETFIHLRYLNLINYAANRVPETICNLINLQVLKITSHRVLQLPSGLNKLKFITHVNVVRT